MGFSMVAMLGIMAMLDTPTPPTDTASTTARGRLRLMGRPSLTTMVPMVLDMVVFMAMVLAMAMDTASTTARGRLRPRPSLTTMVPMVLDMVVFMVMVLAMATDTASTTARGRLRPRLSPTTMAVMDMPVPTMVATAAMAVDTTGDKSSDHISP